MAEENSAFRSSLARAVRHAEQFLDGLDEAHVGATATLAELRAKFAVPLNDAPMDAGQVVDELAHAAEDGLNKTGSPRFFGWVNGGALPAALGADWLTSVWDQNAGMYAVSPAATVVEEVAGAWLKDIFRLPAEASFALVTGCQMAHVTGLASARHKLLADRGWDVEAKGLSGAPRIRILTSTEVHGTVLRAARLVGLGTDCVTKLAATSDGRLGEEALRAALQSNPDAPTIVVLQAGDLNIGAFDDFAALIPLAHNNNAWVHVDGAFGLWVEASPSRRHLLAGAQQADSWATDGHKWLNVPYDCGYAFVRDAGAHRASFAARASYLTHSSEVRDPLEWNIEWSRRGRGFATYAALRQLGRNGITEMIDRNCDCCRALVNGLGALDGAEALNDPQINQGLVRFTPRDGASTEDGDAFTEKMMAAINDSGEAFFTGVTWRGRRAMRVSVTNWRTSMADVERVIAATRKLLQELRG